MHTNSTVVFKSMCPIMQHVLEINQLFAEILRDVEETCRSKPVKPSFTFGTQIKIISESFLTPQRNYHIQGPER